MRLLGTWSDGPEQQADAAVSEGDQVVEGLLSGHRVVARHARELEPVDRGVDEHDRQVALGEAWRSGRAERRSWAYRPPANTTPGHLLVEEQVDVGRLGEAAGGARAQHRREAVLGEGAADDVGERREDRVLQLGQHEPDEAGPLAAQLRRSLVAEHVERREHRLTGRLATRRGAR